jgi:hypothetical protein
MPVFVIAEAKYINKILPFWNGNFYDIIYRIAYAFYNSRSSMVVPVEDEINRINGISGLVAVI